MLQMLKNWLREEKAVIAIEVGILMPVMLTLLLGIVDIGTAIYLNQKVINADQMIADLLAREDTISTTDLQDAVTAGQLTLAPYDANPFGVDVAGIQFNGGPTKPTVMWRYTVSMSANTDVPANAANLGADQEGLVVVTTQYKYVPYLTGGLTHSAYMMKEIAFARGRNGLFIPKV